MAIDSMVLVTPAVCNPLKTFPYGSVVQPFILPVEFMLMNGLLNSVIRFYLNNLRTDFFLNPVYHYFKKITGSGVPYSSFKKYLGSVVDINSETFVMAFKAMVEKGDEIGEMMDMIDVPVFAVIGKNDFLVGPGVSQILKERLRFLEMSEFDNATHFPQAERPDFFNYLLGGFVDCIDSGNCSI
ncbi:alpha/beta hydrolase [Candidatus Micrarchaeota archaeon]|nr:alpha/beta hydrolase [Candidatus Micrarchaeota archaeon]